MSVKNQKQKSIWKWNHSLQSQYYFKCIGTTKSSDNKAFSLLFSGQDLPKLLAHRPRITKTSNGDNGLIMTYEKEIQLRLQ